MQTVVRWSFLAVASVFVALGIPLALGRVPPNPVYGFRMPRTLSDPDLWYAVNCVSGVGLVLSGAITAGAALVVPILLRDRPAQTVALANAVTTTLALLVCAVVPGLWMLAR